jgi:AraC family transcriptional regulator
MILTSLPDPDRFNEPSGTRDNNIIIFSHTRDKYFYPAHETPYLFVANFLNSGNYILNHQAIKIPAQHFYFLNMGDELEIAFNRSGELKTLLILFNRDFIDGIFNFATASAEHLLEAVNDSGGAHLRVLPVPFYCNAVVQRQINRILPGGAFNGDHTDARLFSLVSAFLLQHDDTARQIRKIRAVKKSTQSELYKRLFLARQFMHDNVCEQVKVEDIAREVCLNKFHFLKTFKDLYDITPHQYFIDLKLKRAYGELKTRRYPVGDVCNRVGFESLATFSHLFKKRFGISPSHLAKNSSPSS